ncbi:MAG: hypothetical protein R3C32_14850 [Chloroflexota bacterium]
MALQNASGRSDVHHNKVWYTKIGVDAIDSTIKLRSNDIHGVGTEGGIYVESGTGSQVWRNRVQNFQIGIEVDVSGTTIRDNDLRGNLSDGCIDTTSGSGTAGTGNIWSGNVASPGSTPAAICANP